MLSHPVNRSSCNLRTVFQRDSEEGSKFFLISTGLQWQGQVLEQKEQWSGARIGANPSSPPALTVWL